METALSILAILFIIWVIVTIRRVDYSDDQSELHSKDRMKPANDYMEMIEREKQAEIEYLKSLKNKS